MRSAIPTLAILAVSASLGMARPAFAADPAPVVQLTSEIVTHRLTSAQLQEDFRRFRFSLEHAHAALYRFTPKPEMDARFDAIAARLDRPMTDLAFFRLLAPLIDAVHNSHTNILAPPDAVRSMRTYASAFPLVLRYEEGRAYVAVNLSGDRALQPGMEVTAVNGRSMAELAPVLRLGRAVEGFAQAPGYARLNQSFWLDLLLEVGPSPSYTLEVRDPATGRASQHRLGGVAAPKVAAAAISIPAATGPTLSLAVEPDSDLAYMRLRNFVEPDTAAFFRKAFQDIAHSGVGNLIIDLRGNHGGIDWFNSDLLAYLSDRPFRFYRNRTYVAQSYDDLKYMSYELDDFLLPDQVAALPPSVREHPFEAWSLPQLLEFDLATDHAGGVQTPKTQDHFPGRVYLLVDGDSGSSAAEVPALMHHLGLATIIGEEPDGSYQGEVAGIMPTLTLPNSKITIKVPLVRYQNDVMAGVREGRGVEPTFTVPETLQDAIAGVDTAMTFTRALIRARAPARQTGGGPPGG